MWRRRMKKSLCLLTALTIACPCYTALAATEGTAEHEYSVEQPQDVIELHELEQKDDARLELFAVFGNRYDHQSDDGVTDKSSVVDIKTTFKINDYFTAVTQSAAHQWWDDDVDTSTLPSALASNFDANWRDWFFQGYVQGKYNIVDSEVSAKIGRFFYVPAYGIVHGEYAVVSGGLLSYNYHDKFSITAVDGQNSRHFGPFQEQASTDYYSADFMVNILPILNVKGAYMSSDDDSDDTNYYEIGFDVRLPLNFAFETAYTKSDADTYDTGYYAKLQYGQAIPFVGKTFDLYVIYHDLEENSIMSNDIPLDADREGVRFGCHYTPIDNVMFTVWYDDADVISTDEEENFFRFQVDFFFNWKAL